MFQSILDLEYVLDETNQLKHKLNNICEICWDLLSPSGTQCSGSFQIQNNINSCSDNQDYDEAGQFFSKGDAWNNVTDLIMYGKHVRNTAKGKDFNVLKPRQNICKLTLQQPGMNERGQGFIKGICSKELSKIGINTTTNVKFQHVKQTPNAQLYQMPSFIKRNNSSEIDNFNGLNKNGDYCNISKNEMNPKMTSEITSKSKFIKCKYSHLCSLTLSDSVKQFKMPEDFCYLLKQCYSYEHHKLKLTLQGQEQHMSHFMNIFYQMVKTRLEIKLQTNKKQEKCYVKYVNIAHEFCKSTDKSNLGGLNINMQYRSEEELYLHESKYQYLMELQLQRRIMNAISDLLTV